MLTAQDEVKAAALLDGLWHEGRQIGHLPEALRPATRAEGYGVQSALIGAASAPVVAWKIAATSAAGQAHINVDGPMAGRIIADRVLPPGADVPLRGNNMRVAELEFAFLLGRDLVPRAAGYGMDEVRGAVAGLCPAIELPASRYEDFCSVGAPALVADNACANLFVFGAPFDEDQWRGRDLAAWEVRAEVAGKGVTKGIGANVLGDPWLALHWLVNECAAHGLTLMEGQLVSTGTCLIPVEVAEGDRLCADYGDGVRLEVSFS